jgi:hypothetical protein
MLFPKDLHGRSFGNYERPISHCSFGIPGGSGSAWNRSSTTRIHSSARSPMSRLVNPVTGAPTVAPLAVLVDFVAGLINHYRRTSDEWAVSSDRRYGPPWLTAVNTTSCLVVIDPVSSWEPANPHCQGRRHLVDTGRLGHRGRARHPSCRMRTSPTRWARCLGRLSAHCALRCGVRTSPMPSASCPRRRHRRVVKTQRRGSSPAPGPGQSW